MTISKKKVQQKKATAPSDKHRAELAKNVAEVIEEQKADGEGVVRDSNGRKLPAAFVAMMAKPGEVRNPKGRPKGSRHNLAAKFLEDLRSVWEDKGADCLDRAIAKQPMDFARMVASLLPKELLVKTATTDDMTDADLEATLDKLADAIAAHRGLGSGPRPTHGGTGKTTLPQ